MDMAISKIIRTESVAFSIQTIETKQKSNISNQIHAQAA